MSLESPNYNNSEDRALYDKLFYHNNDGKPLTEQEEEFCKSMYHMEEVACGLDGDRGKVTEWNGSNDEDFDEPVTELD